MTYTVEFLKNGKPIHPIRNGRIRHIIISVEANSPAQARKKVRKDYQDFCVLNGWEPDTPELKVWDEYPYRVKKVEREYV